jgi:hypothetical protein
VCKGIGTVQAHIDGKSIRAEHACEETRAPLILGEPHANGARPRRFVATKRAVDNPWRGAVPSQANEDIVASGL